MYLQILPVVYKSFGLPSVAVLHCTSGRSCRPFVRVQKAHHNQARAPQRAMHLPYLSSSCMPSINLNMLLPTCPAAMNFMGTECSQLHDGQSNQANIVISCHATSHIHGDFPEFHHSYSRSLMSSPAASQPHLSRILLKGGHWGCAACAIKPKCPRNSGWNPCRPLLCSLVECCNASFIFRDVFSVLVRFSLLLCCRLHNSHNRMVRPPGPSSGGGEL